jgi:hypothetical protein
MRLLHRYVNTAWFAFSESLSGNALAGALKKEPRDHAGGGVQMEILTPTVHWTAPLLPAIELLPVLRYGKKGM